MKYFQQKQEATEAAEADIDLTNLYLAIARPRCRVARSYTHSVSPFEGKPFFSESNQNVKMNNNSSWSQFGAGKMAHWVKVFALKNCQAEFPPQHLHKGKRRASTSQNCPVCGMACARPFSQWQDFKIKFYRRLFWCIRGLTVENKGGAFSRWSYSSCSIIFWDCIYKLFLIILFMTSKKPDFYNLWVCVCLCVHIHTYKSLLCKNEDANLDPSTQIKSWVWPHIPVTPVVCRCRQHVDRAWWPPV